MVTVHGKRGGLCLIFYTYARAHSLTDSAFISKYLIRQLVVAAAAWWGRGGAVRPGRVRSGRVRSGQTMVRLLHRTS